jgi:hypothetical protein
MSMKEPATNEQPSAEAFEAAWKLHNWMVDCKHPETHDRVARLLHSFAQQRVSAETERWKARDRQRLEQINRLQETVQSFQNSQAERPAPPPLEIAFREAREEWERQARWEGPPPEGMTEDYWEEYQQARLLHHFGMILSLRFPDLYCNDGQRPSPSQQPLKCAVCFRNAEGCIRTDCPGAQQDSPASTGEQPDEWVLVPRSPTTEMLKAAYDDARADDNPLNALDCWDSMIETAPSPPSPVDYTERALEILRVADCDSNSEPLKEVLEGIVSILRAIVSERDAAAIRAFGKRVWSDGEEVAYQAGVSDTQARLREPEAREAILKIIRDADMHPYEKVEALIPQIVQMLK